MSGVSGGSLRIGVFVGLSDHNPKFDWDPCKKPDEGSQNDEGKQNKGKYVHAVDNFFEGDFLSPLLTTFLYADLPAPAILPTSWSHYDRASALESAFERAFDRTKAQSWDNNSDKSLASPFFSHWDPTLPPTPAL